MGRKSNGEGSISFESKKGLYRAAITAPDGKRLVRRFKRKTDATKWVNEQRTKLTTGTYIEPSKLTIGEWLIDYLNVYKKPTVRPKTLADYKNSATYIIEKLGDMKIQKLSPITVQQFYNDLDVSPRTKIQIHRLLKALLDKAITLDIVSKNIMDGVETPKAVRKDIEVYTKEEVVKILTAIKESPVYQWHYPLFLLAFTTGVRMGELIALKCSNVGTNSITIKETLVELYGKDIESEPKTNAGRRKITLGPEVMQELNKLVNKRPNSDDFVFKTKKDKPYTQDSLRKTWRRILVLADVPYKSFHAIRHTHASQLIANGIPVTEVAKRLGHSRISHTLNIYSHSIPDFDNTLAEKIDEIFMT